MSLSLRELQLVFDGTHDAVLVVDPPRIRDANQAACRLLDYSHKQVVALPDVLALAAPGSKKRFQQVLQPALDGPSIDGSDVEITLQTRVGARIDVSMQPLWSGKAWFLFVRPDEAGRLSPSPAPAPEAQAGAGRRELEESRNRYRQLVEGLADGLVTLNERGEFLFLNRTFASMLGYRARSRLVARAFVDCVAPQDQDRVRRALVRVDRGEVARIEVNLQHLAGHEVPVLLSGRALPKDEGGKPRGSLLLITDFAERRALGERLELARRMEALSGLAGGIAHDFNNLLTGILGNASRIRITSPDPAVDSLARSVEESAELAARLTQRLLALVRGQAPRRKLLDLGELAAHTLALLGKVLPDSIRLETDFGSALPPVLADESQLQQAILNLSINARDAMLDAAGHGVLRISVHEGPITKPLDDGSTAEERGVVLVVQDSGPGIPKKLRARIFDPFFTTKGLGRGVGLGLATVWQLVDSHGGTVDVDDAPGGGARFILRLPARVGREARPPSPPTRRTRPGAQGSGTILLAEDEQAIREMVSQALSAQGYQVLSAADGREALGLWEKTLGQVDLLFLDVRMPVLDGPEVLRRARRDRPGVPCVFSSGFIPEEPGADERLERVLYLPKPYRIPDLVDAVRAGLRLGKKPHGASTSSITPAESQSGAEESVTTDELPAYRPGQARDQGATLTDEMAVNTIVGDVEPIEDEL
jgi:PAS domain S-box-containing protein